MFPAQIEKVQHDLAAIELKEIAPPGNTERLELLSAESEDIDPILNQVVVEATRGGHFYHNMIAKDDAKVSYGNQLVPGAKDPNTRHSYHDSTVEGRAHAHYGDIVGDKGVWDS